MVSSVPVSNPTLISSGLLKEKHIDHLLTIYVKTIEAQDHKSIDETFVRNAERVAIERSIDSCIALQAYRIFKNAALSNEMECITCRFSRHEPVFLNKFLLNSVSSLKEDSFSKNSLLYREPQLTLQEKDYLSAVYLCKRLKGKSPPLPDELSKGTGDFFINLLRMFDFFKIASFKEEVIVWLKQRFPHQLRELSKIACEIENRDLLDFCLAGLFPDVPFIKMQTIELPKKIIGISRIEMKTTGTRSGMERAPLEILKDLSTSGFTFTFDSDLTMSDEEYEFYKCIFGIIGDRIFSCRFTGKPEPGSKDIKKIAGLLCEMTSLQRVDMFVDSSGEIIEDEILTFLGHMAPLKTFTIGNCYAFNTGALLYLAERCKGMLQIANISDCGDFNDSLIPILYRLCPGALIWINNRKYVKEVLSQVIDN